MKRTIYAMCSCGRNFADHYETAEEKEQAQQAVSAAVINHERKCDGKIEMSDLEYVNPYL